MTTIVLHLFFVYVAPKMLQLIEMVVPNIAHCWEKVAHFLEIESCRITLIKKLHPNEPENCCMELFDHWLSSDEGMQPKTWRVLLNTLKRIKQLTKVANDIEEDLEKL